MDLHTFWIFFVLTAFVIAIASLPFFRFVDDPPGVQQRYVALDGLRGFSALSVFIFHFVIFHRFIDTGIWKVPDSRLFGLLGPLGVSLFFMITGFLFWGKMLNSKGRLDWINLYISRVCRIAPMYLFAVLAMLYIVYARTGFELREPPATAASSAFQWLALGIIDTQPDVNGYEAKHVLSGVTWTIFYEWAFYASLIVTAVFTRGRFHMIFVLTALVLCIAMKTFLHVPVAGFSILFLIGMIAASLLHENIRPALPPGLLSAIALACLGIIFITSNNGYGTYSALLLAVPFYLVCSGASLFGLLTTKPAIRLGNMSYSLYLLHGLVLTLVFAIVPVKDFALDSYAQYWAIGMICAVLLVICSALGYILIERPGITVGRSIIGYRKSYQERRRETLAADLLRKPAMTGHKPG